MKGEQKCGTKMTRRQGAGAFVGPDLARFGLHAGRRAGRLWKFSPRTCGSWVQPTAAMPLAPQYCLAYYECFDARRDICAHLHLLPLLASSIGVLGRRWRVPIRDDVSCAIQTQWRAHGLSNAPSTAGLVKFSIGALQGSAAL